MVPQFCQGIDVVSPKEGEVLIAGQPIEVVVRVLPGQSFQRGIDLAFDVHSDGFIGGSLSRAYVPTGPGEYTFTLLGPQVLEPGKDYYVYAVGYNADEDFHSSDKRTFKIELPESARGKLDVKATPSTTCDSSIGTCDDIRQLLYQSRAHYADRQPDASQPDAIVIGNSEKRFHVRPRFYFNMEDGRSIEVTRSIRLRLSIEDPAVARIASPLMIEPGYKRHPGRRVGPGVIEQIAPGTTYLDVSYLDQHLRIPVIVQKEAVE